MFNLQQLSRNHYIIYDSLDEEAAYIHINENKQALFSMSIESTLTYSELSEILNIMSNLEEKLQK